MIFTKLHAATWGDVGKAKEKGFFDFDLFSWMAWTWHEISVGRVSIGRRAPSAALHCCCVVVALDATRSSLVRRVSHALLC